MVFSNNLLFGGQSTGPSPFDTTLIGTSVWLDGSADELTRATSSHSSTECVMAGWIQLQKFSGDVGMMGLGTGSTGSNNSGIWFSGGALYLYANGQAAVTTALYRDVGWYHVLASFKLDEAAAADKGRVFVNGLEVTSFSADNRGTWGTSFTNTTTQSVGSNSTNIFLNGYVTQAIMLDGQSIQGGDVAITDFLDAFTFGTNGSEFTPKSDVAIAALATTAAGNSFCLDFSNSGSLGLDISTPANNLTPESMDSSNQSNSTPSLTFSTYNILDANAAFTSTNDGANTYVVTNIGGAGMRSTIPMSSGKWYWEQRNGGSNETGPAVASGQGYVDIYDDTIIGTGSGSVSAYLATTGIVRINGGEIGSLGLTNGASAVVGVAFDADTGKLWFRDSSGFGSSGNPATGANPHTTLDATKGPYFIATRVGGSVPEPFLNAGGNGTFNGNETAGGNADENGRGNFKLGAVPAGFLSLNTANLTAPTYQGIDYFAPTLYEGNGTGQRVGDFVPFTDVFNVANSAMFQHDEVRALKRTIGTPSSSGGKKGTWSTWYKTGNVDDDNIFFDTGTTATNRFSLQMDASGQIVFSHKGTTILMTNADLKGGGLWRNLVLKVDTGLPTASARAIMYIDGVEVTSFATDNRDDTNLPPTGADSELGYMDSGATQFVGSYNGVTANQWDGYLAETIFLDDQFLSADSFGQLDTSTNKWVPKAISSLTLGDQGFYLAYGGNFGTGNGAGDSTGNSNNLTEIGTWTSADKFIDTPTKNFATLNPTYGYSNTTYSQGNLAVVGANVASQQNKTSYSTAFSQKSGKWWVEFDSILGAGGTTVFYGIIPTQYITDGSFVAAAKDASTGYADNLLGSIRAYIVGSSYGNKVYDISIGTGSGVTQLTSGGIINNNAGGYTDLVPYGIALDMDNKKMWIGNPTISATTWNNETSVSPAANTGGFDLQFDEYSIFISNSLGTGFINFGQYIGDWNGNSVTDHTSTAGGNFTLAPPTDFKAINQDNLDDTQSKITAWAWIKNRDAADNHMLFDRVRGVGNDWHSNDAAAEVFNANTVQRFLERGVQVGSDAEVNTANESYVLWQWLVGDSATTGSTTSPAGSNPSTTIVADHGGFSIGTYTGTGAGATVGHGLSSTPELILIKGQNYAVECLVWSEYTKSTTRAGDGFGFLSSTNAFFDNGPNSYFADTDPNATVITMNGSTFNTSAKTYNLICLKSVAGVCKVGSYIGNSSDDGPYLSLGFKPSYWMVKETTVSDASHDWFVSDSARYTFNGTTTAGGLNGGTLEANDTTAEEAHSTNFTDNPAFDFLADGIKLRSNSGTINATGRTYLYFAMADIGGNGTLPPVYGR